MEIGPPPQGKSLVVDLVVQVIYGLLAFLDAVKHLVAWLTLTVPVYIVRILQYSFTISLTFPTLLGLFVTLCVVATFVIRYRYLARYTQLKEPSLAPVVQADSSELLPLSTAALALNERSRAAPFHNYLDDFLAAIRIFGYLEKPVFHELSRHLQTRRLGAGETLEIGTGDFWCVVEGKVQVFAPSNKSDLSTPPSPDPFAPTTASTFNGYHLLNEVSTGGTLSSLFSILSLFTEDVKLSWTTPPESLGASRGDIAEEDEAVEEGDDEDDLGGREQMRSRTNSDVSQLDEQVLGPSQKSGEDLPSSSSASASTFRRPRSSSDGTSAHQGDSSTTSRESTYNSVSLPTSQPSSPSISTAKRPKRPKPLSRGVTSPLARSSVPDLKSESSRRTSSPTPSRASKRRAAPSGTKALSGTIARATVDTTLAVIPAEAFRKLTKKYPKASGTIVQVVLERFSRVTFMTAHKFLGLTREILRSESSLNSLVSHPLPTSFFTGGGMQALRTQFQPESERGDPDPHFANSPAARVNSKDYFNFVPVSPTVRAPSLPSITPKNAMTPARSSYKSLHINTDESDASDVEEQKTLHESPDRVLSDHQPILSPDTALRHTPTFIRRASALRKQVAAGDLVMSQAVHSGENGGAYYRPTAQTPGLPRMDTWRGRYASSSHDLRQHDGQPVESPLGSEDSAFDLKAEVVVCIAKSIGLSQPNDAQSADFAGRMSVASASALSTPNSPMFPPNGRSTSRSPFGNVLDMMNASTHQDNALGGMLREAVMSAKMDEDASSISASVHESHMGGGGDAMRSILRDMEGHLEILYFKKGIVLVKEGQRAPGFYYVIDGFLDISISARPNGYDGIQPSDVKPSSPIQPVGRRPFGTAMGLGDPGIDKPAHNDGETVEEHLFTVKSGGLAGYLSSLGTTDSYVNITAKTDCFVGFLPHQALQRIIERRPIVLLTLAKRLLSLLSPLVLHIDAALDWIQLGAGKVLYEKGERSTDFYVVINGRLRSIHEKDGGVDVLREYGQNDSIGELDVITGVNRSDTVHSIRDTELVRIPAALFDAISTKHPATTIHFLRLIASRVRTAMSSGTMNKALPDVPAADINLKTVCILGSNRSVPVIQFAGKLKNSLEDLGASTAYLDQGTVVRQLGRHAFSQIGKLKVAGWLADQEQHHRMVLYVADTPPSSQWTLTCIRQADLVLVVAMGDDPTVGEYEKLLLATKTTARKELILLHDERTVAPGSTRPWLRNRPWLHTHHHVELPGVVTPLKTGPTVHDPAAVAAFKHLRERVETRIKKYRGLRPLTRPRRPPHMSDFARLARRLCGKQIGLVLGGGGARGISHIGMLQALEEAGVPIDAIAGCSIGAFVGGLYARETDLLETTGRTKQFSGRMGSVWRLLSDVTYPFVAYTTGHEFNRGIYKAFYNTHLEDFWIPFCANSTNITHSRMEIHRTGYAWRYVRASMTLAGLLPPLSDNGNLLVDGGYMDNTPVGPLRANGIRDVIVVDVGAVDDTSPRNYGDSVSGWWIFLNKLNPFYERAVLSMTEISGRLAYVSSVKTLEDVKNDPSCLYIAMPVQQFETLGGFNQFSKVLAVGLKSAREALSKWREEGRLPSGLVDEAKGAKAIQQGNRLRRMSI